VARRAWARNPHAVETAAAYNRNRPASDHITLPFIPDAGLIQDLVNESLQSKEK